MTTGFFDSIDPKATSSVGLTVNCHTPSFACQKREARAARQIKCLLSEGYLQSLPADVVGHSRLVASTRRRSLIAEHCGRVFKVMGDGLLAEFPSAVICASCRPRHPAANARPQRQSH